MYCTEVLYEKYSYEYEVRRASAQFEQSDRIDKKETMKTNRYILMPKMNCSR